MYDNIILVLLGHLKTNTIRGSSILAGIVVIIAVLDLSGYEEPEQMPIIKNQQYLIPTVTVILDFSGDKH